MPDPAAQKSLAVRVRFEAQKVMPSVIASTPAKIARGSTVTAAS